jgi:hypothetical protein
MHSAEDMLSIYDEQGVNKKTKLRNNYRPKDALKKHKLPSPLIIYIGPRRGQLSRRWRWMLLDLLLQKSVPLELVISPIGHLGVDC